MGTNYYLHDKPDCNCCGRPFESLHIGKSSGGWCFSLHVIPNENINTLDDWRALWSKPGAFIRDEYGEQITAQQMNKIITERGRDLNWARPNWWGHYYQSEAQFHGMNHSQRGPNGLLRHRIGAHCIGHGEGTWDYIKGEFS
mgnify:FL=1